jgi:hypothetical protein
MRMFLTSIAVAALATGMSGPASGADTSTDAQPVPPPPAKERSTRTDLPPVLSKENWPDAVGLLPAELV